MDKTKLFAKRLTEEEYELPGVGTITIRSLSREEAMRLRGKDMDYPTVERRMLAAAMVDPEMTEDDVLEWQSAADAGELEGVTRRIATISGLDMERADKAAYKSSGE